MNVTVDGATGTTYAHVVPAATVVTTDAMSMRRLLRPKVAAG